MALICGRSDCYFRISVECSLHQGFLPDNQKYQPQSTKKMYIFLQIEHIFQNAFDFSTATIAESGEYLCVTVGYGRLDVHIHFDTDNHTRNVGAADASGFKLNFVI